MGLSKFQDRQVLSWDTEVMYIGIEIFEFLTDKYLTQERTMLWHLTVKITNTKSFFFQLYLALC